MAVVRYASEVGWILCDRSRFGVEALLDWQGDGALVLVKKHSRVPIELPIKNSRFPVVHLSDAHPNWNDPRVVPDNDMIGQQAAAEFLRCKFDLLPSTPWGGRPVICTGLS